MTARGRAVLAAVCIAAGPTACAGPQAMRIGTDVSALDQLEEAGAVYRGADGEPGDALHILLDHGVDTVRLRVWHSPEGGYCGLPRTLKMAKRVREAGLDLFLDLHFSDTWADPGHQTKPAAWEGLAFRALVDSVEAYTRAVVTAMSRNGTPSALIQLGNEITGGMLWDDGRVGGALDTPEQWNRLTALLKAAARGVREAGGEADAPEVLLHIDRGGDEAGATWFLDEILARDVPFDAIGLSFYPWWHGTLGDLERTTSALAARYGRPIYVVETAYPWTLDALDDMHNIVGLPEQLHDGYPASPEGQRHFWRDVIEVTRRVPGGLGRGVFWWAPEWIATPGVGSPWENVTWFGADGGQLLVTPR